MFVPLTDGIPGDIEILTATAQSQTELVVNWRPPLLLGTSDPLQLRYSIYYTTNNVLNVNTAQVETNVIPQLQNEYEKKLSGLQKGQRYTLGVVATSTFTTTPISSNPSFNVIVSTYGEGECVVIFKKSTQCTCKCTSESTIIVCHYSSGIRILHVLYIMAQCMHPDASRREQQLRTCMILAENI